jgi:serine/threonine-protein kinase
VRELEATEEEAPNIRMCKDCGKRIGEGRAGSFTQFIFRSDTCRCAVPQPLKDALDAAPPVVQIVVEDVEEEVFSFGETAFPIDRYKPLAQLGSGAGGAVYLARDNLLNKQVAVKMLHMLEKRQLVAFQDEARANSRLKHPNIVGVLDFGLTGDGVPYMVLDYFQGTTLEKVLDRQGTLEWRAVQNIFAQTCDALHYAHQNGVFHRDIKPSNMLLMDNGDGGVDVRIIDFGIAKISTSNREGASTQEQPLVGAPIYMSPDQGLGLPYDCRSEVYSLGCVLFECLTGRPPFIGETAYQTLNMHAQVPPPRLVDIKPDGEFPPALQKLVSKALSKQPNERFENMEEFRQAIQEIDPSLRRDLIAEPGRPAPSAVPLKIIAAVVCLAVVGLTVLQNMSKPHVPSLQERLEQKERERRAAEIEKRKSDINELKSNVILNELNLTGGKWNREEPTMIEGHEVTDEDFKELKDYDKVRSFKVTMESKVTGEGLKYIPGARFTSLLIMSHMFNDEGAKYLAKIKTIRRMCFHYDNKLTPRGLKLMADSLPELTTVHLRFMSLPAGMVHALRGAKKLESVDLGHSDNLTKEQLKELAQIKTVRNLTLTNTGIDDEALDILSALPLLHHMDINENELTDEGLMNAGRKMKKLRSLKTTIGGELTSLGVKRFKKLRPDVQVSIGEDGTSKLIEMLD